MYAGSPGSDRKEPRNPQIDYRGAKVGLAQNSLGFIELLRQHIAKEDTILFQIAAQVLNPEQQDRVLEEFTRVEAERTIPGTREKYEALAASLENTVRQALVRG